MTGDLLGSVLTGVLMGRPRRSRRAQRFLGGGGLININTVLTAAGLAWGAYEQWQQQQSQSASPAMGGPTPPLPPPGLAPTTSKSDRLVRIAVAAAYADGVLSAQERAGLETQAREAGASDALVGALRGPMSLEQIVAGVTDPAEKTTLYMVAFTVLRADEQVTGSERIFLAKLASLLGLSPGAAGTIEQTVAARIDAEPEG